MKSVTAVHIQLVRDRELGYTGFRNSDQAAELGHQLIKQNDREHLIVLSLDGQNKPINVNIVHVGSAEQANTHPRDILKTAILSNATSILVLHNHPSGDVLPSAADKDFTEYLRKACDLMCIKLLDSIIIGDPDKTYYSMASEGLTGPIGMGR